MLEMNHNYHNAGTDGKIHFRPSRNHRDLKFEIYNELKWCLVTNSFQDFLFEYHEKEKLFYLNYR